jgi:DNA polymerase III epsilon subunit-like protein
MINARQQAIQIARAKLALNPLYLDTETTGRERNSEIIEISIIDDMGEVVFESLAKPSVPIPMAATRIHGITNDMVKNAPSWMVVWPKVQDIIINRTVGIYNSEFDLRMMIQTLDKYRMRTSILQSFSSFCIMKLFAQYIGEWDRARGHYRWHSLEDAGRQCRIPLSNTHRARDDSLLARAVLHYMASDASVSPDATVSR